MIRVCIGQVIPTVILRLLHHPSFHRIVSDIDQIGAGFLIPELLRPAISAAQDMPFGPASAIPLTRKERIDFPFEICQIGFSTCSDGIVYVVRHLTQAQHLDSMLSGQSAVEGKVDQMVTVGIEEYAVIGAPLVTMGQDVLEKDPTLHISQAEGRMGLRPRISESFW